MSIVYEKFHNEYECIDAKTGDSLLSVNINGVKDGSKISVANKIFELKNGKCNILLSDCDDGEYKLLLHEGDVTVELGAVKKVGKLITLPYESEEMAKQRKNTHLIGEELEELTRRIEALEKCVFRTTIL